MCRQKGPLTATVHLCRPLVPVCAACAFALALLRTLVLGVLRVNGEPHTSPGVPSEIFGMPSGFPLELAS